MKALALTLIVLTIATTAGAQTATTVKGDAAAWGEVSAAWHRLDNLKTYRMRVVPPPGTDHADKMSIITEVANPGRFRFVIEMQDMMTLEMIKVDKEFRRRITLQGEMAQAVQAQPSLASQIFGGGIFSIVSAVMDPVGFAVGVVSNIVMSSITEKMMPQAPKFGVWTCEDAGGAQAQSPSLPTEVTVSRLDDALIDGVKTRGYDVTTTVVNQGKSTTTRMRFYVLADRQVPRRIEILDTAGKLEGTIEYSDFDAPFTIELPKCE